MEAFNLTPQTQEIIHSVQLWYSWGNTEADIWDKITYCNSETHEGNLSPKQEWKTNPK